MDGIKNGSKINVYVWAGVIWLRIRAGGGLLWPQ
jgi:uncharacterized protein YraI